MTELVVRRAGVDDAGAIARVQVQGWHEAYTGRMPQAILDAMDETRRARGWRRILAGEFPGEESEVWIAELDGTAIGMASSGACRDDDPVADRIELYAIYVLAEHYGSGAGQALLEAAIGDAPASLWVLEDNPRARSFYERNGFRADGARKDDDRWGEPIQEVRLSRPRDFTDATQHAGGRVHS